MKQVTFDITSETPELTFSDVGIPGPRGLQGFTGEKGEKFIYEDFTPEQLAFLKGEKGDSIKGDQGIQGIKGDTGEKGEKGDTGANLEYNALTNDQKEDLRAPLLASFTALTAEATASKDAAKVSQDASKVSETNAKASETATLAAQVAIAADKMVIDTTAAQVATNASQVATNAVNAASSEVNAKASEVASKASQDAAKVSQDAAESAAATAQASLTYEGEWDASTGSYPAHSARNGLWKVIKAGTVNGVHFGLGSELVYKKDSNTYAMIPAATAITSVNGYTAGNIVLTASDVGALGANSKAVDSDKLDGKTYNQVYTAVRSGLALDSRSYSKAESDLAYLGKSSKASDSDKLEGSSKAQVITEALQGKSADSSLLNGKTEAQVVSEAISQGDVKYLGKLSKASDSSKLEGKSKAQVISEAEAAVALTTYSRAESDNRFLGISGKSQDSFKLEGSTKAQVVAESQVGLAPITYSYSKAVSDGRFLALADKASDSKLLEGKTLATIMAETKSGLVSDTITINGKRLNTNISISSVDIGALPATAQAKDSSTLRTKRPTPDPIPTTIAERDKNGDISARLFKSSYPSQSEIPSGSSIGFRVNNTTDTVGRYASLDALKDFLGTVKDSTLFNGKTLATVKAEARAGLVADTRTVNGKRLNANIEITKGDVGLDNVPNYGATNSPSGTSTALLATQKAAYDASAAPRLDDDRKRKTTISDQDPTGGSDGDIWLQY